MYNDKLVYKVVNWVFFGISLWKEKEALREALRQPVSSPTHSMQLALITIIKPHKHKLEQPDMHVVHVSSKV